MVEKVFDAIYENGVLRPLSPLPLTDGEKVRFALHEEHTQKSSEKALLQQLTKAAQAVEFRPTGPLEAYEAAEQLQKFLEKTKEEGV